MADKVSQSINPHSALAAGNGSDQGDEADSYYIVAQAPLADEHSRVLKHGDTFAVFDHYGDIRRGGMGEEGLYHEGTRFLSLLELMLVHDRPMFLSSTVERDNGMLAAHLTNPDFAVGDKLVLPRGTLHLFRSTFLWQANCHHRLHARHYGSETLRIHFLLRFAADFADIFEIRGARRPRRGRMLAPVVDQSRVALAYEGLDGVTRRATLEFSPPPLRLSATEAAFQLILEPQGEANFDLTVNCQIGEAIGKVCGDGYQSALQACRQRQEPATRSCTIQTSNAYFNEWLERSRTDLQMMISETCYGPYPYAGVPWFSTPFGRDGIITALECLWHYPELARGVLCYLAATQAQDINPEQDAEPGKILHETRSGEMAALGEIPFGRYYGSVDSTPLFLMLAGAYYERTADLAFIEGIWPNLERALEWIDRFGDRDGDGFVEYDRQTSHGLIHQGWKDSHDSVFHADGSSAPAPIALCEVQGYVYGAKRAVAELASALGRSKHARELLQQAESLQQRFEQAFWCEDLGTYALALDGHKQPCRVLASNAGHALFTGIASAERGELVAQTLMGQRFLSGWGIRTIATGESRYNPMAYHNGSVWPHDNALTACGFARYRHTDSAVQLLRQLFDASQHFDLHRMPELYCGFPRRPGEGPTLYPVACAPQSWAAAAVYLLLQASLGLHIDAPHSRLSFHHPRLPSCIQEVRVRGLRINDAVLDLHLQYHDDADVGVNIPTRRGAVEVVVVK